MFGCSPLQTLDTPAAALFAAIFVTMGWVYTARRARDLSRKQHTCNVILQSSLDRGLNEASAKLIPLIRSGDIDSLQDGTIEREAFRLVANHYEFLAAGIRNGDLDERLMRDCLYTQLIEFYYKSSNFIWRQRDIRRRQTIYEHLEWLYLRWEKTKPGFYQRWFELLLSEPLAGKRRA
ncbi:MAG: DUF4760 domain-containing protein [Methylocystis sp.]